MKANSFEMLIFVIKLVTILLCISSALSATLSDGQSSSTTSEGSDISTTKSGVDEEYDSKDASVEKSSTADTKPPPLVFPANTLANETALEILQKNSNASTQNKAASESPSTTDNHDYNATASKEIISTTSKENETSSTSQPHENDYDSLDEIDGNKNSDAENFQDEKNDVENIQEESKDQGNLEETFGFNSTSINPFEEPTLKGGHIAVIFASLLILLSVIAYVGLVLWRNRLESRYGMRQRLVTEDDYYNNNDVRFFGL